MRRGAVPPGGFSWALAGCLLLSALLHGALLLLPDGEGPAAPGGRETVYLLPSAPVAGRGAPARTGARSGGHPEQRPQPRKAHQRRVHRQRRLTHRRLHKRQRLDKPLRAQATPLAAPAKPTPAPAAPPKTVQPAANTAPPAAAAEARGIKAPAGRPAAPAGPSTAPAPSAAKSTAATPGSSTPGAGGPAQPARFGSRNGPAILDLVRPVYPLVARRLHKEGRVVLRLHIDRNGLVDQAEVVQSAGFGMDQAALDAVRRSRFRPAHRGGVPVPCQALLPFEFRLRGE